MQRTTSLARTTKGIRRLIRTSPSFFGDRVSEALFNEQVFCYGICRGRVHDGTANVLPRCAARTPGRPSDPR